MGWDQFAVKSTRVANATDQAIEGGNSIRVYNIVCAANVGAGTVTIELYNTSTVLVSFEILSGDTVVLGGNGFLADKGIQVTASTNASCTIFHSNAAA